MPPPSLLSCVAQAPTLFTQFLYPSLRPSTSALITRAFLNTPPRNSFNFRRFSRACVPFAPKIKPKPHLAKSTYRGPPSSEETQTDFSALNVLGNSAPPATGIDACTNNGFVLNNDMRIAGSGVLLVGGEALRWRPWIASIEEGKGKLRNERGMWEVEKGAWGILDLVWPKPDLLILGTGPSITPVAPSTRQHLQNLGIRLEVQDTRNAAAQFNLLATERGVSQVAAALVPMGWREPR